MPFGERPEAFRLIKTAPLLARISFPIMTVSAEFMFPPKSAFPIPTSCTHFSLSSRFIPNLAVGSPVDHSLIGSNCYRMILL